MQSIKEKKYFADLQSGSLNADDAAFAVSANQWVNAENVRTETTDSTETGVMQSIGSNRLLSTPQPSVTYYTIGSVEDEANNRIVYFNYSLYSSEHKIVAYDTINNIEYLVLLSSQVTGGLGFDKNYPIHSAKVIDGLLYWTDNLNRQRKVNIDSGIKLNDGTYVTNEVAYTTPITQEVISLLKRPPIVPLNIQKAVQPSFVGNNFIKNESFQFAARYYYRDGETSVLSTYSVLANYNSADDNFNSIIIAFDFSEFIDQDVLRVDLVVRYGNTNNYFVINTWDKNIPSQEAQISAHNAGTTALAYTFYNNKISEPLASSYAIKPFDSIPVLSETLELSTSRLFLANNLNGYDTPANTSLSFSVQTQTTTGGLTQFYQYEADFGVYGGVQYFVYIDIQGYVGWWRDMGSVGANVIADGANISTLVFCGSTFYDVIIFVAGTVIFGVYPLEYNEIGIAGLPVNISGRNTFKSNSVYQLGIVFYDFGDRKSGVVTNQNLLLTTSNRPSTITTYTSSLIWQLSNVNALSEIPLYASHYSVVITKSLTTRFFMQSHTTKAKYVTKDPTTGVFTFAGVSYSPAFYGLGIDITELIGYGMGYSFQEGDIIEIYNIPVVLSILAQDGIWIICQLHDVGSLSSNIDWEYQISTPYQQTNSEPYYEVGETYKINNPGTISRQYSTLNGTIVGDCTLLARNNGTSNFYTENMSPNDKFWKNWFTNSGRANFVINIGQTREKNSISYSDTFIQGTRINGLSSFYALNASSISLECGAIRKLQITSKVQNQLGIVMLAICENETASLYLGEVQQYGSNTQTTLTIADNVIGTINILKGSFGTVNPESVIEYRGNVFWLDAINGRYIQYSGNGLYPISNLKMTKFWKLFSDKYISMTKGNIESLGNRPFVFSIIDPYHDELLISIPRLLSTPANGYTPDYPSMVYPFDIWDGQGKTIVYKLDKTATNPHWQGAYTFVAENFVICQNKLYSFKSGQLYIHNQTDNYNNFYGVQGSSKVMCVSNMQGNMPKVYNNIMVEGNLKPDFVYFYNNYPYTQTSDLVDTDFRDYEGVHNAVILRNKIVPTISGYNIDGLLTAEKMRNVAMYCMLQWDDFTTQLRLKFVTFGFSLSRGYGE
jgi:hypothetical protein